MNGERSNRPDPRDVDAEFARMLEDEGLELRPGQAPREPAAEEQPPRAPEEDKTSPDDDEETWSDGADSPSEPPSPESRARSRAAHPSAGGLDGARGAPGPREPDDELDDDEVIYGDFEPPDPDLPEPSSGALWSWTALIGGFALLMAVAFTTAVPSWLGWPGGAAAVGGIVALLLRVPRSRDDEGDGSGAEL